MYFIIQLWIETVFELWKFLKLNATIICTVLSSSNYLRKLLNFLLSHCVKYPKMLTFSVPYFPVYGPNHILIFPYMDRIVKSTILSINGENADTILSIYEKIQNREIHPSGYFTQCQMTKKLFFSISLSPLAFSLFDMKEGRSK